MRPPTRAWSLGVGFWLIAGLLLPSQSAAGGGAASEGAGGRAGVDQVSRQSGEAQVGDAVEKAVHRLPWSTMDAGGGLSSGDQASVAGTVGQPDACRMTGGDLILHGGFWSTAAEEVFADGFESGDVTAWSGAVQ